MTSGNPGAAIGEAAQDPNTINGAAPAGISDSRHAKFEWDGPCRKSRRADERTISWNEQLRRILDNIVQEIVLNRRYGEPVLFQSVRSSLSGD